MAEAVDWRLRWDGEGLLAATLTASAGVIHLAMVPSHMDNWVLEGTIFALVGWLQLGAAVWLLVRPSRRFVASLAVANLVLVALWGVSRTSGLPFAPEPGGQPATAVDLIVVGLEVAFVLWAIVWLVGRRITRPGVAALLSITVVLTATMALVAPSARNHAHGSGGDQEDAAGAGHVHGDAVLSLAAGHTHPDDFAPYKPMDVATFKALGEQLALVREVTLRYPTVAAAVAAGLQRNGSFVPGQGAHYLPTRATGQVGVAPIERPAAWLYAGTEATSPVVGVMYAGRVVDFAGPNDRWHAHTDICQSRWPAADGGLDVFSENEGMTLQECSARSGQFRATTGPLMHVWTVPGWESPIGVFSHDNPLVACTDGQTPAEVTHAAGGCRGLS